MPPLPPTCTLPREEPSVAGEYASSQPLDHLSETPQLDVCSHTPVLISTTAYQRCEQMVQDLLLSVPSCSQLDTEAIKRVVGKDTIRYKGSIEVQEAAHENRKVALKCYRNFTSSDGDLLAAWFCNEIEAYSLLCRGGVGVVPLLGVYLDRNGANAFRLIYEWMEGLSLEEYLESKQPGVERGLKLIIGIARCLAGMHYLDIVHENLRKSNILINKDGTPYIAGLGNAFILSRPRTAVEDRMWAGRYRHSRAPELVDPGTSPNATVPTHSTKAGNMYDFGIMAFEVLTGRPPFARMENPSLAIRSMVDGDRPPGLTASLWDIIKRCWHEEPSKRISAREALELLEEVSRA